MVMVPFACAGRAGHAQAGRSARREWVDGKFLVRVLVLSPAYTGAGGGGTGGG